MLRLHPRLAPVKAAVLPLVGKDGQPELAREVHERCASACRRSTTTGGAIGKRYRRQDEIGTPFCLTIDHQSLEDHTVTLRDRDSLAQERLPIEGIAQEIERRVERAVEHTEAERCYIGLDELGITTARARARGDRHGWTST